MLVKHTSASTAGLPSFVSSFVDYVHYFPVVNMRTVLPACTTPQAHHGSLAGLELMELYLPLPPECFWITATATVPVLLLFYVLSC